MKKRVSILIAGVLIALVCISLAACGEKGGNETYFVKTDGAKILGNDGTPIGLYGTNLGGWLVQEEWLVPTNVDGDYGQIDMMLTLANRFGMDGMNELVDVYMDNWVTELDFKRIADMGLNCVRIPFTYLNFMNAVSYDEESESYVRTPFDSLVVVQDSFARLDRANFHRRPAGFHADCVIAVNRADCFVQFVEKVETNIVCGGLITVHFKPRLVEKVVHCDAFSLFVNGRRSVGRRHRTVLRRRLEFHDLEFQARRTSLVLGTFQLLSRRSGYGRASGLLQYEQGRNRENMGKTQLAKLRRKHDSDGLHSSLHIRFQHERQRQPHRNRNFARQRPVYSLV